MNNLQSINQSLIVKAREHLAVWKTLSRCSMTRGRSGGMRSVFPRRNLSSLGKLNEDKSSARAEDKDAQDGPLAGVRVVEVGNFIAGPHCATILGYYGAEVIKVEPPGGDQIRSFRNIDPTGTSWWWRSIGRNKKSVVVDLRKPGAQQVVRDLCVDADVLLENFRPGKMEEWGLGKEDIRKVNDSIIYTRVSGYGQDGPYSSRPGFASTCEAMGGFRYLNGVPGMPSVRPNLSLGDTLAGINAALGTVMALFARGHPKRSGSFQVVDSSIYESVFNLTEGLLCDYDGADLVRGPSGSTVSGIAPTNTYPTQDGKSVVIGANSDTLFKRLLRTVGRSDIAESPLYDDNQKRVKQAKFIDDMIGEWTSQRTADEVLKAMQDAQVPSSLIYSIEDIVNDPQYKARGMIESAYVPSLGRKLKIPGMSPKLSETPGRTRFAGGEIGQHSKEVFGEILNYDKAKISQLIEEKAVFWPASIPLPK